MAQYPVPKKQGGLQIAERLGQIKAPTAMGEWLTKSAPATPQPGTGTLGPGQIYQPPGAAPPAPAAPVGASAVPSGGAPNTIGTGTQPPPPATQPPGQFPSGASQAPQFPAIPAPTGVPGGGSSELTRTGGGGDGSIAPQQGNPPDTAAFESILAQRMAGNTGGPSWEEIVKNTYEPQAKLIDQNIKEGTDAAIENLISRGVLTSSTSVKAVADIAHQGMMEKNAFLGQLGLEYEEARQNAINNAIQASGILIGNKLSANATITSANIGAAAQVKSAAIHAGATVQAASINAQAMLQRAAGDWALAKEMSDREINKSWEEKGIDPLRFKDDPLYRQDVLLYLAEEREANDMLDRAMKEQILAGGAFG